MAHQAVAQEKSHHRRGRQAQSRVITGNVALEDLRESEAGKEPVHDGQTPELLVGETHVLEVVMDHS